MLIAQTAQKARPYAPMTKSEVFYVFEKKREYRGLLALIDASLYEGDGRKAAQCRVQADMIQRELYQKYDVII
ncbi:hypothetical protein [Paenibacillus sp. MMO-177]|uniref:hypothetical protein n=1 Tax=Paenibacillus sp. MMO-177 TaxID=3081289 RepID=UPI00301747DB